MLMFHEFPLAAFTPTPQSCAYVLGAADMQDSLWVCSCLLFVGWFKGWWVCRLNTQRNRSHRWGPSHRFTRISLHNGTMAQSRGNLCSFGIWYALREPCDSKFGCQLRSWFPKNVNGRLAHKCTQSTCCLNLFNPWCNVRSEQVLALFVECLVWARCGWLPTSDDWVWL